MFKAEIHFKWLIYLFQDLTTIHWSFASHTPPTGDLSYNPGMCPDWESNRQPFGLQVGTQSTQLHQPGKMFDILFVVVITWQNIFVKIH